MIRNYFGTFGTSRYPALRVTIDYHRLQSRACLQPVICGMSEKRQKESNFFDSHSNPPPTRAHVHVQIDVYVWIESHMTYDVCPTSSNLQLRLITEVRVIPSFFDSL